MSEEYMTILDLVNEKFLWIIFLFGSGLGIGLLSNYLGRVVYLTDDGVSSQSGIYFWLVILWFAWAMIMLVYCMWRDFN